MNSLALTKTIIKVLLCIVIVTMILMLGSDTSSRGLSGNQNAEDIWRQEITTK